MLILSLLLEFIKKFEVSLLLLCNNTLLLPHLRLNLRNMLLILQLLLILLLHLVQQLVVHLQQVEVLPLQGLDVQLHRIDLLIDFLVQVGLLLYLIFIVVVQDVLFGLELVGGFFQLVFQFIYAFLLLDLGGALLFFKLLYFLFKL